MDTLKTPAPETQEAPFATDAYPPEARLHDFGLMLRAVLEVEGMPAAVMMANAATRHRFTGVYRFDDDGLLTNLCTWDKQECAMSAGNAVPVHESYCMHILQSGKALTVIDSSQDDRLAGHPRRADFRSYCGAPLLNHEGDVAGTFCCFDAEPHKLGASDFEQVHIAAAVLQDTALAKA